MKSKSDISKINSEYYGRQWGTSLNNKITENILNQFQTFNISLSSAFPLFADITLPGLKKSSSHPCLCLHCLIVNNLATFVFQPLSAFTEDLHSGVRAPMHDSKSISF